MKNLLLIASIFVGLQNVCAQCENFEMTITTANPLCYNFSDGDIDIFASGGNGQVWGYITNENGEITLDENLTGTSPNQLSAGWYYIYLYDELGCELFDTVYLEDPDEMEIIMNITLPSAATSCDGIAEIDTVLHYVGVYENLTFWWTGGPGGLGQTIKSDLCYDYYSITVNNEIGCGVTKEFSVGNVAIHEDEINRTKIFPNPSQQFITIQTHNPMDQLLITDHTGREIMVFPGEEKTEVVLDLQGLPAGIYCVQIASGDSIQFTRILKQ